MHFLLLPSLVLFNLFLSHDTKCQGILSALTHIYTVEWGRVRGGGDSQQTESREIWYDVKKTTPEGRSRKSMAIFVYY
jgi:hypothetical protein